MKDNKEFVNDVAEALKGIKKEESEREILPVLSNKTRVIKDISRHPVFKIHQKSDRKRGCFNDGTPYNLERDAGFCYRRHPLNKDSRVACSWPFCTRIVCKVAVFEGCGIRLWDEYYCRLHGLFAIILLPSRLFFRLLFGLHRRQPQVAKERQEEGQKSEEKRDQLPSLEHIADNRYLPYNRLDGNLFRRS